MAIVELEATVHGVGGAIPEPESQYTLEEVVRVFAQELVEQRQILSEILQELKKR